MWQDYLILIPLALYVAYVIYRRFCPGKSKGGCHGCSGCSGKSGCSSKKKNF